MILDWALGIIQNETNKRIRNALRSVSITGSKTMTMYRNQIINEWFGEFNGVDVSAYSVNPTDTSFYASYLKGNIKFSSWTDSDMFQPRESAERWRKKHGGSTPSNEYVLSLMFNEGIIGLPAIANTTPGYSGFGWENGINLNFHQRPTNLTNYLQEHDLWTTFEEEIENQILSKIEG